MIYKKNWVKIKVQNIFKKNVYVRQEIRYNPLSLHKFDGYVDRFYQFSRKIQNLRYYVDIC